MIKHMCFSSWKAPLLGGLRKSGFYLNLYNYQYGLNILKFEKPRLHGLLLT